MELLLGVIPLNVEDLHIVLHIRAVAQVLVVGGEGDGGAVKTFGGDDDHIRAGVRELDGSLVLRAGVVVEVEGYDVAQVGLEEGGLDVDLAAHLLGLRGHTGYDGVDSGVGAGDTGEVDGGGGASGDGGGGELQQAVELREVVVQAGGVALPDGLLKGLLDELLDLGDDFGLEGHRLLPGTGADEVLGVLAAQGFRAEVEVDFDNPDVDFLLGEGNVALRGEAATGAVLEDGGHVEVVEVGRLLDAGLLGHTLDGRATEDDVIDDDVAVSLHVVGQAGDDDVVGLCHSGIGLVCWC